MATGRLWAGHTVQRRTGRSEGHRKRRPTDLLQLLEVLAQEAHGALRLGDAQVNDAVLQHLLDPVPLHVQLAPPQALVLLQRLGRRRGHGAGALRPTEENTPGLSASCPSPNLDAHAPYMCREAGQRGQIQ